MKNEVVSPVRAMRTMTSAQMNWNLDRGTAWWELNADGTVNDEWYAPIWTRAGCWMWNNGPEQRYELQP